MRPSLVSTSILALLLWQLGCAEPEPPRASASANLLDQICDALEHESLEHLSAAATAAFKQANLDGEAHGVCARTGYHTATVQFVPAQGGDVRPMHEVRCRVDGNTGDRWNCQYFKSERILLIGKRGVSFASSLDERLVRNATAFLTQHDPSTSVPVPRCGSHPESSRVRQFTGRQLANVRRIYIDFDGSLNAALTIGHVTLAREQVASGEETFKMGCWFNVIV